MNEVALTNVFNTIRVFGGSGGIPLAGAADASGSTLVAGMDYCMKVFFLIAILLQSGIAQTRIDLFNQARNFDFSRAADTKTIRNVNTKPASCSIGSLILLVTAPPGQNLFACTAINVWSMQGTPSVTGNAGKVLTSTGVDSAWTSLLGDVEGPADLLVVTKLRGRAIADIAPLNGQSLVWSSSTNRWEPKDPTSGAITIRNAGTLVGTRNTANYIAGSGLINAISDTGTELTVQQMVDPAVFESRSQLQSGGTLSCISAGGSTTAYTCSMSPALTTYTIGMLVHWRPDASASVGSITLNIDSLGARPVVSADGNVPTAADIQVGQLYLLWYDGAAFRLLNGSASAGQLSTRPACTAATRGRTWVGFQVDGFDDNVAVCIRAANGTFLWRTL